MNPSLSGPELKPRSGVRAKQLVVILHGWGADGANLIDLAEHFSHDLPEAHFIAPNGPETCEMNPYGYQWFSLADRNPAVLFAGVRLAAKALNEWLDAKLAELSLENESLALVGFSQGTMLALEVAMRRVPPVNCVVGFSGTLLGAETLPLEIAARPPVCLIHGQYDEVVPFAAMNHAESALATAGVSVETHVRPLLGHSIDLEGLDAARRFLGRHLK